MKLPLKVLVPIDLPPNPEAIDFALQLREPFAAEFVLLHVVPRGEVETFATLGGEGEDVVSVKIREAATLLEREVERCRQGVTNLRIGVRVTAGLPFREICRMAEAEKCGLIVIATHGRTGVPHLLLGSTAERVVQHASCPVLSFKPRFSITKRA